MLPVPRNQSLLASQLNTVTKEMYEIIILNGIYQDSNVSLKSLLKK